MLEKGFTVVFQVAHWTLVFALILSFFLEKMARNLCGHVRA